jgi:tetratricopeptide (TPR) repeat protein
VSWGLVELLCQKSAEAGSHDPARAVALASLAVQVSQRLKEWQPCEKEWLYELRAYAFAHLASAYRVSGDLRQAERATLTSERWWQKGSESMGDALGYEPLILSLKASLRKDQRRFAEAIELLDTVIGIYIAGDPATQDFHMAGRTFLLKAKVLEEQGDFEQALSLLREAAPLIDPERAPRLVLCLRHNHVDYLSKLGRSEEARALLPQAQALAQELGNALDLVRLRWVEGRIAGSLGDTAEAEGLFLAVRDEFVARGISFDTALVSLELAALYARENRHAEMQALAREAGLLLTAQGVPQESFATFERTVFSDCTSPELMQGLMRSFMLIQRPPGQGSHIEDLIA